MTSERTMTSEGTMRSKDATRSERAVLLHGSPGSPYTRKMVAALRYRRVPYRLLVRAAELRGLPQPKVRLLPTFYLPNDAAELEAVVDSTPLIRRFEREIEGRAAVPADPVLALLDALIEDYADEWLTKPMFHYRWSYPADIAKSAAILPRLRDVTAAEEELVAQGERFAERQIGRLGVVGSNQVTGPVIEASYVRVLDALRRAFERRPFLLGHRPGAADFAVYGQLSQLARFDPTPSAIALERAPRVVVWCDLMDDLSGFEVADSDWLERTEVPAHLGELLTEIGRVYAPYLLANTAALQSGAERVETVIDGQPWTQTPFPYQGKCLKALREHFGSLGTADRSAVLEALDGTGCEALFD